MLTMTLIFLCSELTFFLSCLFLLDLHIKLSLPQGYEANLHPLLIIVWVCCKPNWSSFMFDFFLVYISQLAVVVHSVQLSLFNLILSILLFRDGVPGSQSVTDEFNLEWPQVLSGMQNVALAWVDGRSGTGRGQKTSTVDPRRLASMRVKDYLGVVESVGSNMRK